jgi:peptide-methionine (R)-S-oxide reductase
MLQPLALFPLMEKNKYPYHKTDQEWQQSLSPEAYRVLREKGTEYPFSGEYCNHFENGNYHCKGCGTLLFESKTKFDSHCGWPSFDQAVEGALEYHKDSSHGMLRTEIVCAHCGGHQGHVFDDGPTATGVRYCVNSESIHFMSKGA